MIWPFAACHTPGMRPRCSVLIATSIDGLIARIDWLATVEKPGEDCGSREFFDSVDALVLGRGTYETALGFDPWRYEGKCLFVLTHARRASLHGERRLASGATELLAEVAAGGAGRGGGS